MAINVSVNEKSKKLIIEADLETPVPSTSGKTMVVVSTRGNMKTAVLVGGKPLTVGLNAYVPKD